MPPAGAVFPEAQESRKCKNSGNVRFPQSAGTLEAQDPVGAVCAADGDREEIVPRSEKDGKNRNEKERNKKINLDL